MGYLLETSRQLRLNQTKNRTYCLLVLSTFWPRHYRRYFLLAAATTLGGALYLVIGLLTSLPLDAAAGTRLLPQAGEERTSLRSLSFPGKTVWFEAGTNRTIYTNAHRDISHAYENNWVGFPSMQHIDCKMTINQWTPNILFPPKVNRTYPTDILTDAQNCSSFIDKYGFGRYPAATEEEERFPIAYVLLFHKDLDQVLFLLRAIYRPHNAYCLSVDKTSSVLFMETTSAVARCLPNVFLASKMENVVYAGFSRLMADIHCFRDLLAHPIKWQYIINTPGQQFPLRTNLEAVQILKELNGTNDIQGVKDSMPYRYRFKYKNVVNETTGETEVINTHIPNTPPPHGLTVVKCSAYGAFSRAFVWFVLTNQVATDLLEWCRDVYSPDELYWGTLNQNDIVPAPGGYAGPSLMNSLFLASFALWSGDKTSSNRRLCATTFVRCVCIFSPSDLPFVVSQPQLFANKFYINHHPAALHCLDERIYNKSFYRDSIDTQFYKDMISSRITIEPHATATHSQATDKTLTSHLKDTNKLLTRH